MFVYEEVMKAVSQVAAGLQGRTADQGVSYPWVANMAVQAGAGDHLEIGTMYGGSAISVALAKKVMGLSGDVYCVDPFGPRPGAAPSTPEAQQKWKGSPDEVMANAKAFGVQDRMKIIVASSQPWPEELEKREFVSAYIDGDHTGGMPWWDIQECCKRTEYYVGLDNFEEGYPEVENAVMRQVTDPNSGWTILFKNCVFIAMRKRNAGRSAVGALRDVRMF